MNAPHSMKAPIIITAALSAVLTLAQANAALIVPTSRDLGGYWGGYSIEGEYVAGGAPGTVRRYDPLTEPGVIKSSVGTFTAPVGYVVNPSWAGSFDIDSAKIGGTSGFQTSALFVSADSNPTIPTASPIDGIKGYTYTSFATSSTGSYYEYDFSSMPLEYLPAGTLIYTAGRYNLGLALTITSSSPGSYLEYVSDQSIYGLANGAIAEIDKTGGTYTYSIAGQVPANQNNGAPALFVTSENLTSLRFEAAASDAFTVSIHAPLIQVPEPSASLVLGGLALLPLVRRRR